MTIAAVAKLAGVSSATVSRVINNYPHVSPEVSQSVHQAIESLKYVPSPPGKRRGRRIAVDNPKATGRLTSFALIVPETRSAYYPALLSGFAKAADGIGRGISVRETENCVERQAEVLIELMDKKVAGVALVPTTMSLPPVHQVLLRYLQKESVPIVMLHRGVEGVKAPLIAQPYEEIGYEAAQRLTKAGHRRIIFLGLESRAFPKVVAGMRSALEKFGILLSDESTFSCGISTQKDIEKQMPQLELTLHSILTQPIKQRPTAIFCSFDYLAECVLDLLRRWGVSVPREISIMSFGGAWRSNVLSDQLSAVTVDERSVGQLAVDILNQMVWGALPIEQENRWTIELGFHEGSTIAEPSSLNQLAIASSEH